jgi:hypothetical protein
VDTPEDTRAGEPADARPPSSGAVAAERPQQQQPSLVEAVGGPVGLVETSLPAITFVVAYSASGQDTETAAIVAVAAAAVLAVVRLARRESPRFAVSGLIGVAFAAFIATRSGRAEDFFLPGLLANAAYATAFLVSILVRRPLVGFVSAQLTGEGRRWREDRARLRTYTRASWLWVGVFAARLAVQLPLYVAGAVVALGVARTAMGVPLVALALWLTYRYVRAQHPPPAAV